MRRRDILRGLPQALFGTALTATAATSQEPERKMGIQALYAANRQPSDLFYNPYPLYLECAFNIDGPSLVTVNARTIIMHKGVLDAFGGDDYPVGAGIMLGYRGPFATQAGIPPLPETVAARQANTPIWITRTGQNINGVKEHYWSGSLSGVQKKLTAPGWYNFEVWAFAQTDKEGLVNADGICCLAQDGAFDMTSMDVRVEPI